LNGKPQPSSKMSVGGQSHAFLGQPGVNRPCHATPGFAA